MIRIRNFLAVFFLPACFLIILAGGFFAHARAAQAKNKNCDIEKGACQETAGKGISLCFDILPKPVLPMSQSICRVVISKAGSPVAGASVTVAFSMPGMFMGPNISRLHQKAIGAYEGRCVIVRCPSGGSLWRADVDARLPGNGHIRGSFVFRVGRDAGR